MKKILLFAILLGGCAALRTPKVETPSDVTTPVSVEKPTTKPEEPKPENVEPVKPTVPVVTPVELDIGEAKPTRFILEYPTTYAKYIPRVEKFFKLVLTDPTVFTRSKFDFSDATPDSIRERVRAGFTINITTYKPTWGRFSKAIAYHSNGWVYLSTYFLNRPDCDIINTLVHEPMHYLGYSHGGNSPDGKDYSVPYWMGDRAQELCEAGVI